MTRALDAAENPYAAPAARLENAPYANRADASRGMRFLALLIDGLLFFAVPLVAVAMIRAIAAPIVLLDAFAVVALVQGGLLHAEAQSIGKAVCGLRIVRCDGGHPGLLRLVGLRMLLPAAIAMIPFLGLLFVIADFAAVFDEDRRSLHDHFADTRVVRAR